MAGDATLITGPGGCGKTHRLEELAAAHDGPTVWVRATSLERATELGALRPLLEAPADDHHEAATRIVAALDDDALLLVDDAQHLDESSVATVGVLIGRGPTVAVAHRRSDRVDLAALDDAIRATGREERLGPLDETGLGALLAGVTGAAVDSDALAELHAATGGVPAWALTLAADAEAVGGESSGELLADRVGAELARVGEPAAAVANGAALAPELPDDVLADALGISASEVRSALDALEAGSLLGGPSGVLWPSVQAAVLARLSTAGRRDLHERLAHAVLARGGEVADAAEHLLQSGATGSDAAELYTRAGDEVRFRDPETAIEWYAQAAATGQLSDADRVGTIEAEAYASRPSSDRVVTGDLSPADRVRLLAIRAVDETRHGRSDRAADLFDAVATADASHPALSAEAARLFAATFRQAAVAAVDESEPDLEASHDPLDPVAELAHRLAVSCRVHSSDPAASAALFVDAADALERLDAALVVPDSPHAIGALHLAAAGDIAGAGILVERAVRADPGGPVLRSRHLLIEGWLHLRGGRYELPASLVREPPNHRDGRDRLVFASIVAGLARRNGDIARLRDAWASAEPLLLAGAGDLHHLEVLGELLLAAARLGHPERAEPTLERLEALATAPGRGAWAVGHAWLLVQLGVEADDGDATGAARDRLRAAGADRNHDRALAAAADVWCTILAGEDAAARRAAEIEETADALAARGMPWEASRLTGQAAIRATDATVARQLLESARRLHRGAEPSKSQAVSDAGLSERELEIARYVVDGLTHKEIGAQLYISPKTVEHHVARIRRKVQAGTRAEMLAVLRDLIPPMEDSRPDRGTP